ncbi:MAG: 3-isopropylmalate dehydratase small subunit [Lachnospiraceae bacterium]|nr:3-isopropylmalate dehydratase small subunit [Lachnospiraceae bacterium]
MGPFRMITSPAAVLLRANIDTDIIAPMRRLLDDMGEMGRFAFEPLRFVDGDGDRGILAPDFPLNQKRGRDARILIVGENFGCGSSREQAAQGIAEMGIRCLIGTSFGSIFFANCFQYGILPICLEKDIVEAIAKASVLGDLTVDLEEQTLIVPEMGKVVFSIDTYHKDMLLHGLDEVGMTLRHQGAIMAFQKDDMQRRPWIYNGAC